MIESDIDMKLLRKYITVLAFALGSTVAWGAKPVDVIIETDMGNDIDDALALDLAYKGMDDGKINILAIGAHKLSPTAVDYIDILNTWYGYKKIPIARSLTPVYNQHANDYTIPVCAMREQNGKAVWKRSKRGEDIENPVSLYRRILASKPDSSVVFVSLGFGTELAKLLNSEPDAVSPLNGVELVKKKVKYLSIMAGSYGAKQRAEYNVVNDIASMQTVFAKWPTRIVQNPFELGPKVMYKGEGIDDKFKWTMRHPVVEGYKFYRKMPYNRATWDLHSIVYITDPQMYTESEKGTVLVDKDGFTRFTPCPSGNVTIMSATPEQVKVLDKHIDRVISRKPLNYR